jgi:predicted membrane metal-binding protein
MDAIYLKHLYVADMVSYAITNKLEPDSFIKKRQKNKDILEEILPFPIEIIRIIKSYTIQKIDKGDRRYRMIYHIHRPYKTFLRDGRFARIVYLNSHFNIYYIYDIELDCVTNRFQNLLTYETHGCYYTNNHICIW